MESFRTWEVAILSETIRPCLIFIASLLNSLGSATGGLCDGLLLDGLLLLVLDLEMDVGVVESCVEDAAVIASGRAAAIF